MYGEDAFLDGYWEDRISGPEPYENDLETWELNQLALDREYDSEYDDYAEDEYDSSEYDDQA
jgi:hypothetical protein